MICPHHAFEYPDDGVCPECYTAKLAARAPRERAATSKLLVVQEAIMEALFENSAGVSMAEAVGVLECVKYQIIIAGIKK